MKLEITITDEKKTIKISKSVNIKEFIEILKKEFPNNWEEFELETNNEIIWTNPSTIIIERDPYRYPHPWDRPWYGSPVTVTYGTPPPIPDGSGINNTSVQSFDNIELLNGTYQIELK